MTSEEMEELKGLAASMGLYDDKKPCKRAVILGKAIKALAQEPCEMTAEEYRQRMIQAFHNADCDELIAICVLPTEKEFEHLEWLLKNHYKKEPCGNAIDRAEAIRIASGYCHPANVAKELAKLPSINLQPCEEAISRQAVLDEISDYNNDLDYTTNELYDRIKRMSSVTPQPKTGRWIAYEVRLPDRTILNYRCSVCGRKLIGYSTETLSEAPFCHCGAKMVEPQKRSDKK